MVAHDAAIARPQSDPHILKSGNDRGSQGDGLSATRPPDTEGTMRDNSKGAQPKGDRKGRLAAELRANLQKRKAQARARRAGEADGRPEGIAPAGKPAR
jgi:hypothetical protein